MELMSYLLGKKAGGGGGDTPDLSEYFITELTMNTSNESQQTTTYSNLSIKTPPLQLHSSSNLYKLAYCFWGSTVEEFQFDKENFDTSKITDMTRMFTNCINVKELDLSFFDTSKVETYSGMCYGCKNLIKVDFSTFQNRWNTSMSEMFYNCNKLAIIDISSLNIPNSSSYKQNCFKNTGNSCLQSDGAYADGIPYVYVKSEGMQNDILNNKSQWGTPNSWTTSNVIVKE